MPKLTCPYCNQRALSTWRKLNTNFAWSGKCSQCAGNIGIPSWSLHAWLAILAIAFPVYFLAPTPLGAVVIAVLVALRLAFQLYVVPIERRDA
jgi:hypothetical protein